MKWRTHSLVSLVALALLSSLAGACASLGFTPYLGMDAEQIAAATKDKSAAAGCTSAKGAGYSITTVYVNSDKGLLSSTKITPDCGVEFGADLPPAPPR
jgi:hypothetical protein